MAMLGKRFQRTISMSHIGPGSNLHTEKVQAHHHQQQQQGREHAEYQPANQWEILKNAEAMMMMIMANSAANTSTKSSEEGPNIIASSSSKKNEQNPQSGLYPCSPAPSSSSAEHLIGSPSSFIIPTHHFLDACFFCKRRLRPERDIFIYRGDAAFCTEECRNYQIVNDEKRSETAVAA